MAKKLVLVNGVWVTVSDDVLPAMTALMNNKPDGSMLFGLPNNIPLKGLADQQSSVAGIVQTDAEVTAQKAVSQVANGFVIDVRGVIWRWNGVGWTSVTLTPASLRTFLRPLRLYYNTVTKLVWYVKSDMSLLPFMKKDNPFASQTEVTNGQGTGLVSPATLKNAFGSW